MRLLIIALVGCAIASAQTIASPVHNSNTGGGSLTLAVTGFTCASGKKAAVFVDMNAAASSTVADSVGGNTYTAYGTVFAGSQANLQWFIAPITNSVSAGTITATFASSQSFTSINALCITGGNANDFTRVANSGGFGATLTSGAFTTTNANELVLVGMAASANVFVAGSGYTISSQDSGTTSGIEYQAFTSIQTGVTAGASMSGGSANWDMVVIGVKGAAGAAAANMPPVVY